ncbi:hypothetical protein GJ744_005887 [Endocarpon pusillum]|uniref:Uncharacterized protein n=1 Tax=Endocarpon pusillum TaxID=364733 RepID=A0A8H7APU1_9EURO|nr:hypothetical protein GJ744_005887 [Endocarpon pusillum]
MQFLTSAPAWGTIKCIPGSRVFVKMSISGYTGSLDMRALYACVFTFYDKYTSSFPFHNKIPPSEIDPLQVKPTAYTSLPLSL